MPYSLHDRRVESFFMEGNTLIIRMLDGMIKIGDPCMQVKGEIVFRDVDWEFCSAYVLKFPGKTNAGCLSGEKIDLREFAESYSGGCLEIVDETFGYNQTKLMGFLSKGGIAECIIEIYHLGDMEYLTEE